MQHDAPAPHGRGVVASGRRTVDAMRAVIFPSGAARVEIGGRWRRCLDSPIEVRPATKARRFGR